MCEPNSGNITAPFDSVSQDWSPLMLATFLLDEERNKHHLEPEFRHFAILANYTASGTILG